MVSSQSTNSKCSTKVLVIFWNKSLFLLHSFNNNHKKNILTAQWLKKFLGERLRTLKSTQQPLHLSPPQCSCASWTNPGAREVKLNHYGRALEAAFIKRVINELLCFSGSLNSSPSFIDPDLYSLSVCNPNTDMDSGFTSVWRGGKWGGANEKTTGKKRPTNWTTASI